MLQCYLNLEEYQSCLACNFCREKQYFQLKFFMRMQPKNQPADYLAVFLSGQLISFIRRERAVSDHLT